MPLVSSLPLATSGPWAAGAPQQGLELITRYNLDELLALALPPNADIRWAAEAGTHTSVGEGIVKIAHSLPQTAAMSAFTGGNNRKYHGFEVVTKALKPSARELSYKIPMIWSSIGNGWALRSQAPDGSLIDFAGITGVANWYVMSGHVERARFAADLFYESIYATTGGLNLTIPNKTTYPQGKSPNGIALFTDGTGADGTTGAQHYANPTVSTSGRYKNVYFGYGAFGQATYANSLVAMTVKPHALFPDITSGAIVTDTFGPTKMRRPFFEMAVQQLVLQAASSGSVAAVTNPYAYAASLGVTEENFIGSAFGPRKFWIIPHLDSHPYMVTNAAANSGTGPDFWINVSRGAGIASWCQMACNSKDWTAIFRMYGPGDPQAMRDREMRWEGDLDGAAEPGDPGRVDMFGSV